MGSEKSMPDIAVISFADAAAAGRPIAGVAAAARIVREVAEAGVAEAWLTIGGGDELPAEAMEDIERLSGTTRVGIARDGAPEPLSWSAASVLRLPGGWLIPAEVLARFRIGGIEAVRSQAIRLDAPAGATILRGTVKSGDGPVSRWINRPVSRRISALLLRLRWVRPVHATIGTALLAVAMFVALLQGSVAGLVAGGILFQAASLFDGVDGELARATFRSSRLGAMLDTVVDAATNLLFILGVTISLGMRLGPEPVAVGAWGLGLFAIGLVAIGWRVSQSDGPFRLDIAKRRRLPGQEPSPGERLLNALTIVSSRDFFALLFAALIVAGFPMAVLWLFALAATVWLPTVAISLYTASDARGGERSA
jgi:CDP-L-myo-inositol myo-inositolphosphotransferase